MGKAPTEPHQVELARKMLGYRSHPNRESAFGRATGYPGQPWAGSFIHEVLREAGLLETAFISTTDALSVFVKSNRVFQENPAPGDVVFYSFPSTGSFGQPHVGLVTDTAHFKESGSFRAIEGETASGLSRGSQDVDGVFERLRHRSDVIGFVRPREPRPLDLRHVVDPSVVPQVRPSNFGNRSPLRGTATTAVQFALFETTGFNQFAEGAWDAQTRSVFEQFLRSVGHYEPVGQVPTDEQLRLLGEASLNRHFTTPE